MAIKLADKTEAEWTKQICLEMRIAGAKVYTIAGTSLSSGLPDRLVVHKDWSGLLEFKGEKTILKTNQSIVMRDIISRNQNFCYIIRKPNLIQVPCSTSVDTSGCKTIADFDGTGVGLLDILYWLNGGSY